MRNVPDSSCVYVWFILPGSPCIFPAGYPHPCAAPAGGKNLWHPLPPGRFLKTGPPASRFAGWSRGFIYLYLPARVWHHPAFWFWDSRKNQKMDPRGIQNSKEKEKKKASPSMREKQRKRATSSTTPRRSPAAEYRRSRHLPSGTHEAGKAAAPSPHTRTHSVLRVHVLHYIRRLAPKRSAQAGNNIGGHRVPL